MSAVSDEDRVVLRGLRNSTAWHLLKKIGTEIKNQHIEWGYGPSQAGGQTTTNDDRNICLGAAKGIDHFLGTLENLMQDDKSP